MDDIEINNRSEWIKPDIIVIPFKDTKSGGTEEDDEDVPYVNSSY